MDTNATHLSAVVVFQAKIDVTQRKRSEAPEKFREAAILKLEVIGNFPRQ